MASPAFAWIRFDLVQPIDTLADNSVVDIIHDGTYVWLATGNGLAGTRDGGATWRSYNKNNAFKRSSVSAIAAAAGRLFAATSYDTSSPGSTEAVPSGGGLQISDDYGDNWRLVTPRSLSTPGMVGYDLAVLDSAVWVPCFYGGLIRSLDRGETWENIFADSTLRNDLEERNYGRLAGRYFSVVIDPFHDDTVIVWAGSAEGVQRFYYVGKSKKLASNRINDIAYDGQHHWWYATDRGMTKVDDTLFIFNTYDMSDGLPGDFISAVGAEGDLVSAGVYDTLTHESLGFVISTNGGGDWSTETPEQATGAGRMIEEIAVYDGSIWAACNRGGLIHSTDNGITWASLYFNPGDTTVAEPRNVFHCVDVAPRDGYMKIHAGTDSGMVIFYFTLPAGDFAVPDSVVHLIPSSDTIAYGQQIVSVASMVTGYGDELWLAARPYRQGSEAIPVVLRSTNNGETWSEHLIGPPASVASDVEIASQFADTIVWVATEDGLRASINFGRNWNPPGIVDYTDTSRHIASSAPMLSVEVSGEQTHCGSLLEGGATLEQIALDTAVSALLWRVHKAQLDPDSFDYVGRSYVAGYYSPDSTEIGGNFVPALALQRVGDSTIIWAATRRTTNYQYDGVSITTDRGKNWRQVATELFVWNFDFKGDTVYAATSQGLLKSADFGANWDTISISEPSTGRAIEKGAEVFAVRMVNDEIWVGTSDGVAKSSDLVNWRIMRTFFPISDAAPEEERSYVTPNPYSPYVHEVNMKFHYRLTRGGEVTIRIYDFANNPVRTITGGMRQAGVQYDDLDLWDGRNDKGDIAAGGVYFYIIESSGGDKLWGKLMILP